MWHVIWIVRELEGRLGVWFDVLAFTVLVTFLAAVAVIGFDAELLAVVGVIVFSGSYPAGIFLGRTVGHVAVRIPGFRDRGLDRRIGGAASAFLFFFLPMFLYVSFFEGRSE